MTRRWWSAISPQLGRSALDILPPPLSLFLPFSLLPSLPVLSFLLRTCVHLFVLRDASLTFSLHHLYGYLPHLPSSLFLTPRLDILFSVCVVPDPLSLFSPLFGSTFLAVLYVRETPRLSFQLEHVRGSINWLRTYFFCNGELKGNKTIYGKCDQGFHFLATLYITVPQ